MSKRHRPLVAGSEPINIAGMRFGRLVAESICRRSKAGNVAWHCRCDCGQSRDVFSWKLRSGYILDCGDCKNASLIKPDTQLSSGGFDWSWAFVVFADIPGFPGYKVGSDGSVWSKRRDIGRWTSVIPKVADSGHLRVGLMRDRKQELRFVHHLVLEAFISPRPLGMQACHSKFKDPSVNHSWNLRWDTPVGNMADQKRHGTAPQGSRNPKAILQESDIPVIRAMISAGEPLDAIARHYGVRVATIKDIKQRRRWSHVVGDEPFDAAAEGFNDVIRHQREDAP